MTDMSSSRVSMFVTNDMRLDSRVRREAQTLASAGYDVTVYAVLSDATLHLAREPVDGYTIIRVPMLMRPAREAEALGASGGAGLARRAMATGFTATRPMLGGAVHFLANWHLRWRPWGRRVVERVEPSAIWHAHDLNTLPLALECAERFGGAVVYDSHELFTEAGATSRLPGAMRALLRRLERGWAQRAAAVVTVNESIAAELRGRLAIEEVGIVRNCATPPTTGDSPLREAIGVRPDERVVLYHGSLTVGRGLERLVAAVAEPRLAEAHLVIMGYGPLRSTLADLAAHSPASARIHLLPPVPPAEVTTWVAGADVAAMPIEPTTLNHRLSSPNKLFEAIAAGVPIVGPDFVEFRRVVAESRDGPLGLLHTDHEPATIASAIHTLTSLPQAELERYRERCRRAAAGRWHWEREAQGLLATYASVRASTVLDAVPAAAPLPLVTEAD